MSEDNTPKISVILPAYNVEKWIDRCLQSIFDQTLDSGLFEVICVDDASTDSTMDHLLAWEAKYPDRIKVIQSERNGRQGRARNIGLAYADGDWIAFVDSDDWLEKNYLERLYGIAVGSDYEVVACNYERDFSTEYSSFLSSDQTTKEGPVTIADDTERRNNIMNPRLTYSVYAKLIRKKFLTENDIFFPENLTYEDTFWGLFLNFYLKKAYQTDERLYHYFVNEHSTVLTKNSNHHLDSLTVQTLCWREFGHRGILEGYRYELEIEQIYSGYLAGLKMLVLRYDEPDYNVYLLLREIMLDRIGNYRENPYIKRGILAEKYMLMLATLDHVLSRPEFVEFADSLKKIL